MITKIRHESCNGDGCYMCNGYGYEIKDVKIKYSDWCNECRYVKSFNCTNCIMYHKMPSSFSKLAMSSSARSMRDQRERKLEEEKRIMETLI